LQTVDEPLNESEKHIESNRAVHQSPEELGGEAEIEKQESHFYDKVHPDIV
jgi:hypothetical protein